MPQELQDEDSRDRPCQRIADTAIWKRRDPDLGALRWQRLIQSLRLWDSEASLAANATATWSFAEASGTNRSSCSRRPGSLLLRQLFAMADIHHAGRPQTGSKVRKDFKTRF